MEDTGVLDQEKIHVVNRDKSELSKLLHPDTGPNGHAVWSPPADEILFSLYEGPHNLFRFALRSRGTTQLTHQGSNHVVDWFDLAIQLVQPNVESLTKVWGKLKRK